VNLGATEATFEGVNLSGATLCGADLDDANLFWAYLP
jgi:uncharacterized protein YjbI with pentapeptide repeats